MDPSTAFVAMFEDDHDRLARFAAILSKTSPKLRLLHWRTAYDFIANYEKLPAPPRLIALDHDLFTDDVNDPDPGDGRDVSAFLANRVPDVPILIHSSNSIAADSMLYELRDGGWKVDRISPIGEDWVENYWIQSVIEILGGRA